MVESVETKEKLEKPPLLYDLTSLQREANRILGFRPSRLWTTPRACMRRNLSLIPVRTAVILRTICGKCFLICSKL